VLTVFKPLLLIALAVIGQSDGDILVRATFNTITALTLIVLGLCSCFYVVAQVAARGSGKASGGKVIQKQRGQDPTQPQSLQQTSKENSPPSTPPQVVVSSAKETPASSEVKGSFSELTLFLFASGLALFVALLGWSDQIRAIDKDTREMESCFLEDTGMGKRDFLRIVKPESPDKQLEALTEMVNAGKFKTMDSVQLLRKLTEWHREWSDAWPHLERLTTWKYNLTIALTIALLVAGTVSLFTTPAEQVNFFSLHLRVEMLVLTLPMTIVAVLLGIIICLAKREKALRARLNSMADLT